ncbi:methyltransferase [Ensifer sp. HO-A22]|uniref:Methyltransferase n=1 Tax=Ensifer oleiphilus TaxID=2742698 RepID=A0A7Y6UMU9_9HYPH|nr:class I SAM-dependent methyltransferase [Ensifer oleiphilus]NVD39796.1 methyltransferase [Ensifer oleiphilus]
MELDKDLPGIVHPKYSYVASSNIWVVSEGESAFDYSDGDQFETGLLNFLSGLEDRSVNSQEVFQGIYDWPSKYHLSLQRSNLLRPLVNTLRGPVLEIGAGCGAITRYIAEQGLEVVALEGSSRRAQIAAERCRGFPNVSVVSDSFQEFSSDTKFKTILLIGVLEYARVFFAEYKDRDPVDLMLEHVSRFLADDGVVILAIENQLGLKYFAGYPEDHIGRPMYGLEDQYTKSSAVTFGRHELREKLRVVGFAKQQWWFPFPDYKLPVVVLSEAALADSCSADFSSLIRLASETDSQKPAVSTFALSQAWSVVARNRLHGDLANSFVVVASRREIEIDNALAFYFKNSKPSKYNKVTEFRLEDAAIKVTRTPLAGIQAESDAFSARAHLEEEVFEQGVLWKDRLTLIVLRDGWSVDEISEWAKVWWRALLLKVQERSDESCRAISCMVSGRLVDAIPRNLIVGGDGVPRFIDQEWEIPFEIELGYIFVRGLLDALWGVEHCGEPAVGTSLQFGKLVVDVAYRLGVMLSLGDVTRYIDFERQFQDNVSELTAGPSVFEINESINLTLERSIPRRGRIESALALSQALDAKELQLGELHSVLLSAEEKLGTVGYELDAATEKNEMLLVELDKANQSSSRLLVDLEAANASKLEIEVVASRNADKIATVSRELERTSLDAETLRNGLLTLQEELEVTRRENAKLQVLFRELKHSLRLANLERDELRRFGSGVGRFFRRK